MLGCFAALAMTAVIGRSMPAFGQGCDGETVSDRLRRVEAHGDLATEAGRRVRLADIRLAPEAEGRLKALEGEAILLAVSGERDRWGRVPARVIVAGNGQDMAELLLREGLAVVDPGEREVLCRPALLATEAGPRATRSGIWASMLLAATEPETLAGRAGGFAVVEGRIVNVSERARWTYLNFGRDFRRDFAVSISRRNWQAMQRAGLSAASLRGKRVRVRGFVEMRRAPGMEITNAQAIEFLDPPRSAPAPDGSEP